MKSPKIESKVCPVVRGLKGRWNEDEHAAFVKGYQLHGRNWKLLSTFVPTRTIVQIRTHAQKYLRQQTENCKNGMKNLLDEKKNKLSSSLSSNGSSTSLSSLSSDTAMDVSSKDSSIIFTMESKSSKDQDIVHNISTRCVQQSSNNTNKDTSLEKYNENKGNKQNILTSPISNSKDKRKIDLPESSKETNPQDHLIHGYQPISKCKKSKSIGNMKKIHSLSYNSPKSITASTLISKRKPSNSSIEKIQDENRIDVSDLKPEATISFSMDVSLDVYKLNRNCDNDGDKEYDNLLFDKELYSFFAPLVLNTTVEEKRMEMMKHQQLMEYPISNEARMTASSTPLSTSYMPYTITPNNTPTHSQQKREVFDQSGQPSSYSTVKKDQSYVDDDDPLDFFVNQLMYETNPTPVIL